MVPGHGKASWHPRRDAQLTRDYLTFLRQQMGKAVANFESFDQAYNEVDWSRFRAEPTFGVANKRNAYNVYLEMEQESLEKQLGGSAELGQEAGQFIRRFTHFAASYPMHRYD